jgi:hypothetical protein
MANEFVARNGVIALNNSTVSGSLNVTNGITGSLLGTSSYANNADTLDGLDSTVFATTGSVNAYTASINAFSASMLSYTSSASTRLSALEAATASIYTTTGSQNTRLSALEAATASLYTATASFSGRVGALESYTSSLNNKTSSFATTGSNTFIGTQTITGSINQSGSFTSTGTITAQTLVVQTVSSSVIYSSGSNIFGNSLANTQVFTGSFSQTGSTATFAGSVGIGTTSPNTLLHLVGSTPTLQFGTNANDYYRAGVVHSSGDLLLYSGGSSAIKLIDGSTVRMQIDTNGNVGIGTTSPSNKLDILGAPGSDVVFRLKSSGSAAPYIRADLSLSSYGGFALDYTGTNYWYIGAINGDITNRLSFYSSGAVERFSIASTGAATFSSSVTAGSGFIKTGYSDSYFLLAGGGTTPTSNYAPATGGSYLPLAGGTLTGDLTISKSVPILYFAATGGTTGILYNPGASLRLTNNSGTTPPFVYDLATGAISMGATLAVTGAATFSSTVQSNDQNAFWLYQSSNAADTKYWAIQNLATSGNFRIRALNDAVTNGINAIDISRTGISSVSIALGGALTGTNATFSSTIDATRFISNVTNSYGFVLNRTAVTTYNGMSLQTAGIAKWFLGMRENLSSNNYIIYNESTGHDALTISTSDAATFSNSVTAGQSILISNTTNAYAYQNFGANSGYGWQIGKADNSAGVAPSNGFYIYDLTNSVSRMVISQAGNVGIGTTSPATKLDVSGSLSLNGVLFAQNFTNYNTIYTQAGAAGIYLGGAGDPGNYYDNTSHVFRNIGGGTNYVTINSSGNVGIGTTAPTAMLDIYHPTNGYASVGLQGYSSATKWFLTSGISGDTIQDFSISNNNNGTSPKFRIASTGAATFSSSVTAGGTIAINGNYAIKLNSVDGVTSQQLQYQNNGTNKWQLYLNTSDNSFNFYNSTNTTNRVTFLENGNVGIGTTSPNATLDVAGGITGRSSRVNTSYKMPLGHYSSGETVFEIDPTWTQAQLQDYFGSTSVTWNSTSASAAPGGYAIQIDGAVNLTGNTGLPMIPVDTGSNDLYYMECWIKNEAGSSIGHYMGSIDFDSGFNYITGNPGSYTYNVMSNYNPGTSWTKVYGYWYGTGASTAYAGTGNQNNWPAGTKYFSPQALFNYAQTTGPIRCYISGWKVMKMSYVGKRYFDGNVGIGTTSPAKTLHVVNTAEQLRLAYDTSNTVYSDFRNDSAGGLLINTSGGYIINYIGGSEKMRITSGGNVGIGTTSPTYLLDVNGTFRATGAATFSSSVTTGGNILIGASASTVGALNFVKTGGSPVCSRITFGTDGTGYSFTIAKNQSSTITDLLSIADSGAATFSNTVTATQFKTGEMVYSSNQLYRNSASEMYVNYSGTGVTHVGNPTSGLSFYGTAIFSSTIKTASPTTATAGTMKFGVRQAGTAVTAAGYWTVNIDGTDYYINLLSTTP